MKIAITTKGRTLQDPVDPHFGRAAAFIIFDTDTRTFEVIDNTQNLNAAQGAGIQSAQHVCQAGAEALLSGHCGPKAFRALQAGGVKIALVTAGTVEEALAQWEAGALELAQSADMEGHW